MKVVLEIPNRCSSIPLAMRAVPRVGDWVMHDMVTFKIAEVVWTPEDPAQDARIRSV